MLNPPDILAAKILIVDDLDANVRLLEKMLSNGGYTSITGTTEPREVCDLHRRDNYDLVILDLQMPGMDGFAVLEELRQIEIDGSLPVLVVTAQPGHKLRALEAGARDFVSKPFEIPEVLARVRNLLEVRALHTKLQERNEVLEGRVQERTLDLQLSYLETIFAMTRAAEYKDEDTGAHVQRISYYCRALAMELGQDGAFVDTIFFASPMHDVGKIGIPDHVLLKPAPLTSAEWEIMKSHAAVGAAMLGNSKSHYIAMGAEIALNHHERWDGGGYPNGKRGEDIPLSARIMNLCDIYDALRAKRCYKPALDHATALGIMIRGDARTQPDHFDPAVLAAFSKHHETFRKIFADNMD